MELMTSMMIMTPAIRNDDDGCICHKYDNNEICDNKKKKKE